MPTQMTRRETLIRGLAATSLLSLIPDWAMPALAQGENDVPFTDIPKAFNPAPPGSATRLLDIRKIEGHVTPKDQFFAVQHFTQPDVDQAAYRLKLTGMVNKPGEITLADLRAMKSAEIAAGYECSGNRGASMQGLASSGKWTGVPLNALLKHAGIHPQASEVVFLAWITERRKWPSGRKPTNSISNSGAAFRFKKR
jgi:DMSO/TMAO reductase YedYZ molybdopterin-dependent catalytic subunit